MAPRICEEKGFASAASRRQGEQERAIRLSFLTVDPPVRPTYGIARISAISFIKRGFEVNESGKVIDIYKFTVELAFDEHPRTKPGHVIQVDGTVTKFESGLVYVKTPAAQYRRCSHCRRAE